MKRTQLEHAIRAASAIVNQDGVIVVGSQAILGSYDENQLPPSATRSIEVDIRPLTDDEAESLADLIDGSIGEGSLFNETFGYYVQGVGRRTAVLPNGWADRLVEVRNENTMGRAGYCLEPHDLCVAKLIAFREKDLNFVRDLIKADLVSASTIIERLQEVPEHDQSVAAALRWLAALDR